MSTAPPPAPSRIPVLRPRLPAADKLLPYLRRMDASRIYSNWGPLVTEFSERLSDVFSLPTGGVICANSGMSAIVGAILGTAGRAQPGRPMAAMPDFTFTATGLAAQLCGYQPLLTSSDRHSWSLEPEKLLMQPEVLSRVGVVVPVAPFGRLGSLDGWHRFHQTTGIPVVIDAAACFESFEREPIALGRLTVALSFHATKSFGVGEGGCVLAADPEVAARVGQCLNFGFRGSRNSELASINGKMPEYTAAVGLAELDAWPQKRADFELTASRYRAAFEAGSVTNKALWVCPDISAAYTLLDTGSLQRSLAFSRSLERRGVETRLWYGTGLSAHAAFADCPRVDLDDGNALDPGSLLGLPSSVDMPDNDIRQVAKAVQESLPELS